MRKYLATVLTLLLIMCQYADASVVMTGTRVIYDGKMSSKTVQLKNPDKQPYIVQIETDNGTQANQAASGNDDFVVTPQIFRMEPGSAQSIRLMYIGKPLPEDRESVFYLSFTQLPALNKENLGGNQLVLAITNRVKIFYRPKGLTGVSADTPQKLSFSLSDKQVKVVNSGGYYAVVRHATLLTKGREITLASSTMVPPESSVNWTPSSPVSSLKGARLRLILVNDYGIDTVTERTL